MTGKAVRIGSVISRQGKVYEIRWDKDSTEVYISYAGWTYVGKASSRDHARQVASTWLKLH